MSGENIQMNKPLPHSLEVGNLRQMDKGPYYTKGIYLMLCDYRKSRWSFLRAPKSSILAESEKKDKCHLTNKGKASVLCTHGEECNWGGVIGWDLWEINR